MILQVINIKRILESYTQHFFFSWLKNGQNKPECLALVEHSTLAYRLIRKLEVLLMCSLKQHYISL
jgi:hypothetical protein